MYIPFLIIISALSLFPIWNKIGDYIIKYKKYISIFLYIISILSFLILWSNLTMHNTWEYSIWLLWIILWLPILSKVFNLSIPKKLILFRKEIWILMWVMAITHSIQYFIEPYSYWFWEINFWYDNWITYLAWWMIALIISTILTITSNNFSIKKMWKNWKKLHKITYVLIILALIHTASIKLTYSAWNENILLEYIIAFIPFFIYFIWKILEWKWIKFRTNK